MISLIKNTFIGSTLYWFSRPVSTWFYHHHHYHHHHHHSPSPLSSSLGSLSNYDDDHSDDFKKNKQTIVLMMKTTALHVHHAYSYISLTSTARLRRETSQSAVLRWAWTYDDEFSFLFLNLNKILKNSNPGKVACFWYIERVIIDAIKFERTQIHFFCRRFHCRRRRRRPCLRSLLITSSSYSSFNVDSVIVVAFNIIPLSFISYEVFGTCVGLKALSSSYGDNHYKLILPSLL